MSDCERKHIVWNKPYINHFYFFVNGPGCHARNIIMLNALLRRSVCAVNQMVVQCLLRNMGMNVRQSALIIEDTGALIILVPLPITEAYYSWENQYHIPIAYTVNYLI